MAKLRESNEHNRAKMVLFIFALPLMAWLVLVPYVYATQPGIGPATGLVPMPSINTYPKYWVKQQMALGNATKVKLCTLDVSPSNIQYVRVIGERHSGVAETATFLRKIMPGMSVGTGFVRGKYWFQDETLLEEFPQDFDLNSVLVVVIERNPYDWFYAFANNPLYASAHQTRPVDWKKFVSKKWTMRQSANDKVVSNNPESHCQAKFSAGMVIPCRQTQRSKGKMSVYEMDPETGNPFKNVFELRTSKQMHYNSMASWVPNFQLFKVEDLQKPEYIPEIAKIMNSKFGIKTCESISDSSQIVDIRTIENIPSSFFDYVTCHVDWTVEETFGYSPRTSIKNCRSH